MPVEKWSDKIAVVHLSDDPQFTEDVEGLENVIRQNISIVMDFTGVRYINSSNLSRLLKLRKLLSATDARLILCGLNNQIWGVFLMTGLEKIFEFSDNVPTALATMQID